MDLTQGNMTVAQYAGRFNELAHFAPYVVADEETQESLDKVLTHEFMIVSYALKFEIL